MPGRSYTQYDQSSVTCDHLPAVWGHPAVMPYQLSRDPGQASFARGQPPSKPPRSSVESGQLVEVPG